ncbi:MAG: DNA repair protein RecO [Xanthomonadales bacterium]|nr:DNA repair protein RecO [Xanthomonadales bacterium]
MRVELQPALVLHRRAWRDTSFIVEAFTREHGRVGLAAKGARRARSRWRGLLEPFSRLDLSWAGAGELYTLRDIEYVTRYALAGNALMGGLYASELIMRLTARDDPHPRLFDTFEALLHTMAAGAPAIVALRFFERDLLDELGYGLTLTHDALDVPIEADTRYRYDPESGVWPIAKSADNQPSVTGATLIDLANGRLTQRPRLHEARDLLQAALAPHLGSKPLKSVATLKAMQQFADTRQPLPRTDDRR